jgi:hypothetical protein
MFQTSAERQEPDPMTKRTLTVLVLAAAALAISLPAQAQRWGRDDEPRDGVCFYKDTNFHGDYFCARIGENERDLPKDMNDKITSIRLFGDAEVEVFQDARYEGRSTRFDGDVHDLKREGWNDLISSFRVRYSSDRRGYGNGHGRDNGYNSHNNRNRYNSSDADRMVRNAYHDVLDRDPDDAGLRTYRSRILDDGWSESQVRDALRKSPEYRQKSQMTYSKAQDIVARAYQNVLHRDPDSGASGYINKVMRDHWTQQDVERELRKSPEYRNKR